MYVCHIGKSHYSFEHILSSEILFASACNHSTFSPLDRLQMWNEICNLMCYMYEFQYQYYLETIMQNTAKWHYPDLNDRCGGDSDAFEMSHDHWESGCRIRCINSRQNVILSNKFLEKYWNSLLDEIAWNLQNIYWGMLISVVLEKK